MSASSMFGGCCGFGAMPSLAEERPDPKAFSPILSLDSFVQDWAYETQRKTHQDNSGCLGRKYPKRKDLDITVLWDNVKFTYGNPDPDESEETGKGKSGPIVVANSRGTSGGVSNDDNARPPDRTETFTVKFDNTTGKECATTLTSEKKVKASYEVEVHKSVQTGHNLQLSLAVGGEESPGKLECAYEFNKMLENYKGEKKCEEMETTLTTNCPVLVQPGHSTEARFITAYKTYNKAVHIKSTFSGTVNIIFARKKCEKNGKKFLRPLSGRIGDILRTLLEDPFSPLNEIIDEVDDDLVVHYTSSATFCSSFGVDQSVKIVETKLSVPPIDPNNEQVEDN